MGQDELLALIDQIYEAATDAGRWPVVLQRLADAFGAGEASLSAVSPQAVPWLVAPRTDPAYLQSYGQHYHPLNLFWQRMTRVPVGTAVTDRMVLPKAILHSSPFFNEWSRPQGYLSVMGATLLAEDDWRVEFVVPGKKEFGPEQLKLYDAIAPHLKRAMQLNHRLRAAALDRTYSLAALDSLGQGVLIVDCKARVLFSNRAADGAFNDGLRLADGVLCSGSQSETAGLHLAIAACVRDSLDDSRDTIAISRGPYRTPLSLLVIPLRPEIDWIARHQQTAIIFITDPDKVTGPDDKQLQKQFGLTPAEAGLVYEMLRNESIQAVADQLGIKIATARTHLHRVLAKTGTRSQADLMRLVLTPGRWLRRKGPER
jgi:DNA-binding CsgD family transcriptional regulator